MKTSQDQQGQQEYVDDVTDGRHRRSVVPKSASMGRSIPAVIGCAAKKRCFESIGYYSISPKFADHMDLRLVLLVPKLKERDGPSLSYSIE